MWELEYKESWVTKNWCFWTVVLEKTLESSLDCKKIQPVNPKGNQHLIFIGRTYAEAEGSIIWSPDEKSQLIGKDPDAGKDWRPGGEGDGWMTSPTQCTSSLTWWTQVWPSSKSWWLHPTILSFATPFSSCPQSFPATGSFPMSWLFTLGDQSIGALASALVFPMNSQCWFPLGLTGWISMLSKGLSRLFSSTTIWKYQFFST